MKLQELATTKPTKNIAKIFESYFGSRMHFDKLTVAQAQHMLRRVQNVLKETRRQPSFHKSERNPSYLKLMMMEQALAARVKEQTTTPAAPGTPTPAQAAATMTANIKKFKDPATVTALTKASKGQSLTPDEQKMVAGAALMQTEDRLARAYRTLKESEVQTAQVVLAAQDLVDKMQAMIEDVSELQFKDLPALVFTIKNRPEMGDDMANQFNADATAALSGLLQNVQGAKQQLDAALNVVQGKAPAGNAVADLAAANAGLNAAADDVAAADQTMASDDMADLDAAAATAAAAAEEPAQASTAALGRGRR